MNVLKFINIEAITGIPLDVVVLAMLILIIVLIILLIVSIAKTNYIRGAYEKFMEGKDVRSMEDMLEIRLKKNDEALADSKQALQDVQDMSGSLGNSYQKMGLVKYDAFNEVGGKLSFSLCVLNKKNDGFIITSMHSREGCYTYIKEIIRGSAVLLLAAEEKEALDQAIHYSRD